MAKTFLAQTAGFGQSPQHCCYNQLAAQRTPTISSSVFDSTMYILGTSATAHWGLLNLLCTLTGGTDWLDLELGAMDKRQRIARNGVGMQMLDV
jgi:hypothetical protein